VTHFYLIEVVWPADGDLTGRPLNFRLVAQCVTKSDCERQAEGRAKSHAENGFDSSRDAWWGKSDERLHYYYQTTSRPGRLWNGMKPGAGKADPHGVRADPRQRPAETSSAGNSEEAGEGPDDQPIDREKQDPPIIAG
jgi:hypothetical protein